MKKYWKRILLVFAVILIVPIGINFILLCPTITDVVGDNTTWLMFWGSYLSAIISSVIALFVLYSQLIQNQKENEANRNANRTENEQNRNLQLSILTYQQEQEWLNMFRKSAAEYIMLYSYNDLVDVANIARKDPYKAFYLLKDLFTRAGKADMNLAFIQRINDLFQKLDNDKTTLFCFYNEVLDDIQALLTIRIGNLEMPLKEGLNPVYNISKDMHEIINRVIKECPNDTIVNQFNTAIMTRIKIIEECEEKLREWFCKYIHLEQIRINNILNIKI